MVLTGCRPPGRFTEQHDVFFGIAESINDLIPQIKASWPDAKNRVHIDAWREVTNIDGHKIEVIPRSQSAESNQLFFINLGGYKENEFEEYHYKVLTIASSLSEAKKKAKTNTFFRHFNLPGKGASHIDDQYGIDVDDAYRVDDILPESTKSEFSVRITEGASNEDELHIGYMRL